MACLANSKNTNAEVTFNHIKNIPSNSTMPPRQQRIVYFTRHAEALHNVEEQKAVAKAKAAGKDFEAQEVARKSVLNDQHLADAPLSPKGFEQAGHAAAQLRLLHQLAADRFPSPQIVLVSPLRRALQTATALYASNNGSNKPKFVALEALREKRTGYVADERRSVAVLQQEFPHVNFDDLLHKHENPTPDKGEDNAKLQIRTHTFLSSAYMANLKQDCIAIVTHKAWLRELHHAVDQHEDIATCLGTAPAVFTNAEVRMIQCTWETSRHTSRLLGMQATTTVEQALRCAIGNAVQHWRGQKQVHTPTDDDESDDSLQNTITSQTDEDGLRGEFEAIPAM